VTHRETERVGATFLPRWGSAAAGGKTFFGFFIFGVDTQPEMCEYSPIKDDMGSPMISKKKENEMNTAETIAGHEVNVIRSKDGKQVRSAVVMLGDSEKPGMRRKDPGSEVPRMAAREAVAAELGLPITKVRAASRYSCLTEKGNGLITRRDSAGRIIGVYSQERGAK
jgi:hypothetical protein